MGHVNRELLPVNRSMLFGKCGQALVVTDALGVWKLRGYSNFSDSSGPHSQSSYMSGTRHGTSHKAECVQRGW